MRINDQDWSIIDIIRAFFPLQLIIAHIKYNFISLFFWIILFLIIEDKIGYSFGIPLLFLSPEYLGGVSHFSFLLLGLSIGGFIMGFNTYSYIKVGAHFPFLTTIAKPFLKFCVNNALIPFIFICLYITRIVQFQRYEELASGTTILLYILAFLIGITTFIMISFFFFFRLVRSKKTFQEHSSKPIDSVIHKREKWYDIFTRHRDRTFIYFGRNMRLMASRSSRHFDQEVVEKVYAKNRINASIYELVTILIFFGLGFFNEYEVFEVPAATSIVLLITISLMLFSALHSWLRAWIYPVFFVTLVTMNFLSVRSGLFQYKSYAYGLNYKTKSDYSFERIKNLALDKDLFDSSKDSYIHTLNNWKKASKQDKPKLIIINTSGGGSRSALWTVTVMQELDKASKGKVSQHTQLITGASGGMIGAAYYRELLLRQCLGKIDDIHKDKYKQNISKDMLNRLSFMASTNDVFIRYQKARINGYEYTKDRGYAFEEQLHTNTGHILNHKLSYYKRHEQSGMIPTMIFSPTIINDGRRLLICSQPTNFLTGQHNNSETLNGYENIDYHSLMNASNSGNIRFSSVLRASATFPFVMPMITLPTEPEIQLMDAGIRDNYGGKTLTQFLNVMQDWIRENTSGVIVLQIRDTRKIYRDEQYDQISFLDKLTLPFGNMYKNFPRVQDFNQDELIELGTQSLDFPIDFISFNLIERRSDRISLSWHLTKQEKRKIFEAFDTPANQVSMNKLIRLIR